MRLYKAVPAAIAVIILGAIVAYSNPVALAGELAKSDVRFVLIGLATATAGAFMRVVKWSILVNVPVLRLFPVQMLGITISNFTPGKVAEPVKTVLLKMRQGTDVSVSLPSIIWERINDLLVLIALAFFAIQGMALESSMLNVGFLSIGVFGVMIIFFLVVLKNETAGKKLFGALRWLPVLNKISPNFIETFYKSRIKKRTIVKSLVATAIPWVLEGYIFYFALKSVGIEAEPITLAGIIALSVLIGVLSSLPGGLGSFEAVAIVLLGVLGIGGTKTVAGLVLYRFMSFGYITFLGWMSFLYLSRHLDIKSALK